MGAAINPFAPPHDFRVHRLAKKIAAGAQFVQSQYCYDVPMFRSYMQQVRDYGLDRECFILCGVGPLASARTAAGCAPMFRACTSPTRSSNGWKARRTRRPKASASALTSSTRSRKSKASPAIHVMAYRQEEFVAEIVHESGVLKGRRPWTKETTSVDEVVAARMEEILDEPKHLPHEMAGRRKRRGHAELTRWLASLRQNRITT
jgi:5,10-methylenetetrahydrofolate reductase